MGLFAWSPLPDVDQIGESLGFKDGFATEGSQTFLDAFRDAGVRIKYFQYFVQAVSLVDEVSNRNDKG